MNKTMINLKLVLISSVYILLIVFACLIGCTNKNDCSENQTLIVERGIAQFSFEYPVCLETFIIEVREDLGYTSVELGTPVTRRSSDAEKRISISVFIRTSSEDIPDAVAALEFDIDFYRKGLLDNFEILERSEASFKGLEVHRLIYAWDAGLHDDGSESISRPTIARDAYFDYGGMVWEFHVSTAPLLTVRAETILDHMLNSLRFLK